MPWWWYFRSIGIKGSWVGMYVSGNALAWGDVDSWTEPQYGLNKLGKDNHEHGSREKNNTENSMDVE